MASGFFVIRDELVWVMGLFLQATRRNIFSWIFFRNGDVKFHSWFLKMNPFRRRKEPLSYCCQAGDEANRNGCGNPILLDFHTISICHSFIITYRKSSNYGLWNKRLPSNRCFPPLLWFVEVCLDNFGRMVNPKRLIIDSFKHCALPVITSGSEDLLIQCLKPNQPWSR